MSFVLASQGTMLTLDREKADLTASFERRSARLRQILEVAPN